MAFAPPFRDLFLALGVAEPGGLAPGPDLAVLVPGTLLLAHLGAGDVAEGHPQPALVTVVVSVGLEAAYRGHKGLTQIAGSFYYGRVLLTDLADLAQKLECRLTQLPAALPFHNKYP